MINNYKEYIRDLGIRAPSLIAPALTGERVSKNQKTKRQHNPAKAKARRKMAKASRRINRGKKRKT